MSSQDDTKLIFNYHPNFPYHSQALRAPSLDSEVSNFLQSHPQLQLGGSDPFWTERRHHQQIFGIHNLPKDKIHPIKHIEHTAIPGPYGTIPLRIITPSSTPDKNSEGRTGALIYFHGGGYTVGSIDEFENGLRLLAETSSCQVWAAEYRLAPEHPFPVQLDEYDAVIDHLQSGAVKDVDPDRVAGGGDSAGGNMTAAISLRRLDRGKKPLCAQVLLYPEARMPFDTPAATENNSGFYLQCNGIFSFANNYLPRPDGPSPGDRYVSPGMQPVEKLKGQPPAAVFTSGFDPLRDVGYEYAHKLDQAGVPVSGRHYAHLTHGWLQMTAWSKEAVKATEDVGRELRRLVHGSEK